MKILKLIKDLIDKTPIFIINIKKCEEFTKKEVKEFDKLFRNIKQLNGYGKRILEPFNTVYFDQIRFMWCNQMTPKLGILGAYDIKHSNTIFVMPVKNCPELILPTIAHELTHMQQHKKYGFLYILLSIPFIREFTIEPEARNVEKIVESIINDL